MKPFILCLAVLFLYSITIVTAQDFRMGQRNNYELRYVTDEISVSASLFCDSSAYSDGRIIYNYDQGLAALEDQLKYLLRLDDSFVPLAGSYWTDPIKYKVYFYDHSNVLRVYLNGLLVDQLPFDFPVLYKDSDTLFTKVVTVPTVVVSINAGRSRYRVSFLRSGLRCLST